VIPLVDILLTNDFETMKIAEKEDLVEATIALAAVVHTAVVVSVPLTSVACMAMAPFTSVACGTGIPHRTSISQILRHYPQTFQ
jgi:hypothetical protein